MPEIHVTDDEALVIRDMALAYDEGETHVSLADIASRHEGDENAARRAVARLVNYAFIIEGEALELWEINGIRVLEAVEEWDNPPAADHWKVVTRWFRSKRWSVPVVALFVGVPVMFKWVEMLAKVLAWFVAK